MLSYPHISPVALQLGPFAIRWYALAYLVGVLSGWWLVGRLNKKQTPPVLGREAYDDIMAWAITGIILGGRAGYVLFYRPDYYFGHLSEILMVWHGGMSFHGGLLGVIAALFLFARKYRIAFLKIMDLLAPAAPIGLFLGRMANFVNGELYGRATGGPLGMVFPGGGDLPRYPSQLFEAGLEGVLLFIVLLALAVRTRLPERTGALSGLFLIGYSLARITAEFFREPDAFISFLPSFITMGQLLSLPMLVIGIYLVIQRKAD
jgi:phosphatidylglycerol:prolipoprotein diacylglycerol transferase